jgi:hypothetical protein
MAGFHSQQSSTLVSTTDRDAQTAKVNIKLYNFTILIIQSYNFHYSSLQFSNFEEGEPRRMQGYVTYPVTLGASDTCGKRAQALWGCTRAPKA